MYKCATAGRPWIPIRILHGFYVFTADPKCQYVIRNMCKSVRRSLEDKRWIRKRIMNPYNDFTWIPCGVGASRPWIPIRILHGAYVGAQRAGSGGVAWLGGHGKWCSRVYQYCMCKKQLHDLYKSYFIGTMCNFVRDVNPVKMLIFHLKYV